MTDSTNLNEKIVESLVKERRSDRRWKTVRSLLWAAIFLVYAGFIFTPFSKTSDESSSTKMPYASVVRLSGIIMPNTNFSAERAIPVITRAFQDKHAKGVILLINSPGGSPVQASIIHDRILQLKKQYHKNVVVIGEDALASGAYLVASAADKIYVSRDTVTGSIGVIMSGFGFSDFIGKLGITRRVYTAGANKDRLDPFEPTTPADEAKLKSILEAVHQDFIADVENGRGSKLSGDKAELFSGDFWTGQQAVKLGLADDTGDLWTVMQQEFGVTHYREYSVRTPLILSLLGGAETFLHLHLINNNSPIQAILATDK